LNQRLGEVPWLAGDEYSMADIITFPWLHTGSQQSPRFDERGYIDLAEYPNVKRWYDEIAARPAVQRGLALLTEVREQTTITAAEREVYFGKTQFQAR
jgi:GST-like protein